MDQIREIIIRVENLKQSKNFSEAINLLQRSLGKYADDYRLYEELADIYLYNGELEKSMKAVDFALRLNPESATGSYLKGFIFLSQDRVLEAIKYLENSNNMMGNNAEVLRNLGWAYTML
jgi:tetratricopeptide (TPR) repeat protein